MEDNKTVIFSTPFYKNLNGLRFIGALSVFLFHCVTLGSEIWGDFFRGDAAQNTVRIFSKGHHGVGLFFVLSGFLITSLLLNEAQKRGSINVFGFFMRRLLRIWPLYFIVVLFGFFIFPHLPSGSVTQHSFINYSLFLSNFDEIWNGWNDSINFLTVTWSVSIEEQFYIGWVVLMALLPAFRKGKWFLAYFSVLMISSIAFRIIHFEDERTMYFHSLSVISDLAIGGYLSYISFKTSFLNRFKEISRFQIVFFYLIGVCLILFSSKIFVGFGAAFERLFIGLFFAFVIFEQVFCSKSFFKADKLKGFFQLGEISYGLYMYHSIVIYFVQLYIIKLDLNNSLLGFLLFVVMSALFTVAISRVSYNYVEKPLLELKRFFR